MKRILPFLFVAVLSCPIYSQSPEFCEYVLGYRNGRSDLLIPITVKSELFSGKIVVESYNLFDYLKATRGFDVKACKSFMSNLLKEKQELEMKDVIVDDRGFFLSGKNVEDHSFAIVGSSQAFEVVFAQGCEQLIRYYFSPSLPESNEKERSSCKDIVRLNGQNLFIRPRYDFNEQNNVVARLFEMDIPIYRDDISGSFEIAYSLLK